MIAVFTHAARADQNLPAAEAVIGQTAHLAATALRLTRESQLLAGAPSASMHRHYDRSRHRPPPGVVRVLIDPLPDTQTGIIDSAGSLAEQTTGTAASVATYRSRPLIQAVITWSALGRRVGSAGLKVDRPVLPVRLATCLLPHPAHRSHSR
jgi:hypothetical protein